ncbi:cytochrome c biogenesis protein CcdA [Candidatus Woesearchaeota archaeon]|nr:cytochrome c biogenesis protein CcdA [Candidatus Woesearchaeota archaeon]
MKKNFIFFILALVFALLIIYANVYEAGYALIETESNSPPALQKIVDYNQEFASNFMLKISFLVAFVAGILGILSPCILPFLPAYFSYTFKEKTNITKMTFIFFAGFSFVFVLMGAAAGYIGSQIMTVVQSKWLVSLAGLFMIFLGVITIKGKDVCQVINIKSRFKNDVYGTLLFGMFFAFGWTACIGPILAGILGIGAILGNVWYSMLLLFFYSLGNLIPLFIISMLYDKYELGKSKFIKGKMFNLFGYNVHSTNLVSGLLFILLGVILLLFKGTAVFNTWDILGTKEYFYLIQRLLLEWQYTSMIGMGLLLVFVLLLYFNFRKK